MFSQHPIQVHEQQQFEKAQEKAQGLLSSVPVPSPNRTLSEKTQELSAEDRAIFLREGNHLLVRIHYNNYPIINPISLKRYIAPITAFWRHLISIARRKSLAGPDLINAPSRSLKRVRLFT